MSELLKNIYNTTFISKLSKSIQSEHKSFDSKKFSKNIFNKDWSERELKNRMNHIAMSIGQFLPRDYDNSISILSKIVHQFDGLEGMIFPEFVECYGLDKKDWNTSIKAMELFTKYSSSEFAIRHFILSNEKKALKQLLKWSKSKNEHVRRLASEGSRPRLPWAMALPPFKKDPKNILPILENLKEDSSLYVRRSVANNFNDIAKDNPMIVINTFKKWKKLKNENVNWLIKHGLRTLLKQGNPAALELIGLNQNISVESCSITCSTNNVKIGKYLSFNVKFNLLNKANLRIEYAIGFLKNNGENKKKVFKLSEKGYESQKHLIEKKHSFKIISTRKYYTGKHYLYLIINGIEYAQTSFELN